MTLSTRVKFASYVRIKYNKIVWNYGPAYMLQTDNDGIGYANLWTS